MFSDLSKKLARRHGYPNAKPTFDEWMRRIDAVVEARMGLSFRDLPDCCYRDWYDEGMTPKNAAARAIRNAKDE